MDQPLEFDYQNWLSKVHHQHNKKREEQKKRMLSMFVENSEMPMLFNILKLLQKKNFFARF